MEDGRDNKVMTSLTQWSSMDKPSSSSSSSLSSSSSIPSSSSSSLSSSSSSSEVTEMDVHIQQTNDRLQCIQQHLMSPTTFQSAARELLDWCSDVRAFQWQFEQCLVGCLSVISHISAQPGYDLELGYRLLAVCTAHRDKFSSKSASSLSVWCEELGRQLLSRHQSNNRSSSSSSTTGVTSSVTSANSKNNLSSPIAPDSPLKLHPGTDIPQWQQQNNNFEVAVMGQNWPNEVNVYSPHTSGPASVGQQRTFGHFNGGIDAVIQKFPNSGLKNFNRTTVFTNNNNGADIQVTCHEPLSPENQQVTSDAPYSSAQMASGNSHPFSSNYSSNFTGNQYPQLPSKTLSPGLTMTSENMADSPIDAMVSSLKAGGPIKQSSLCISRSNPYPSVQQHYMQSKRAQFPSQVSMPVGLDFGAQQYVCGPYGNPIMQPSHQQMYSWGSNRANCLPNQQMSSGFCSPSGNRPNGNYVQPPVMYGMQAKPMRSAGGYGQYGHIGAAYGGSVVYGQPSPVMHNPASPMASSIPSYLTPAGGDLKPVNGGKIPYCPQGGNSVMIKKELGANPMMSNNYPPSYRDDLRLTFPVKDGVVLPPFRLEHNLNVSNHVFHLRESVYQTLMMRSDLELQLKCFHHEDRQANTNWPVSVTVSVNARMLAIERNDNRTNHRPLYLKDVCLPGRNTIQITVSACCCSHLFVLQLVHRPSIKSVLQGLLRKRMLPADHCITKIKRSFSQQPVLQCNPCVTSSTKDDSSHNSSEPINIKLHLRCPITCQPISLPARGHDCKHIQCFDLESYLQFNCERGLWRCPVCNKQALLEGLEIDQFIWSILNSLVGTEFEEVTIDSSACWKPVPNNKIMKEDLDSKRWIKSISPSSMTLPTMLSWQQSNSFPGSQGQTNNYQQAITGTTFCNSNGVNRPPSLGSIYPDTNQALSPSFPTPDTPDFLNSLSQMNDNLLFSDSGRTTQVGSLLQQSNMPYNHSYFNPSTPSAVGDYQPGTPAAENLHSNGQQCVIAGNACDEKTQLSITSTTSPSMISITNIAYSSSLSSTQPCTTSTTTITTNLASRDPKSLQDEENHKIINQDSHESMKTPDLKDDFSTEIGFHTSSLIGSNEQEEIGFTLLPDTLGDPTELLSYLGPSDSLNNSNNNNNTDNDDLLSLFS